MVDVRRLPVGEDNEMRVTLDDLAREGALRMIAAALEAEVDEYVASFVDERGEDGKRLVVRNGKAKERRLTVGSGTLPILYLHGLSTGDFGPALRDLLGEDASGLSSSSIQRLTEQWQDEHAAFRTRELRFHRYAYWFVDGVHVSVRLGEDPKLCLLVVIGVREAGTKELLAVEDGYRESTDSWAAVMRDLKARGANEPKLVVGTERSEPGPHSGTCIRTHAARRAGSMRSRTCSTACPSGCSHARRRCCTRSWKLPPAPRPPRRLSGSARSSSPSTRRRWPSLTATGST